MLFSNQDDDLKPLMPTSTDDVPLYRTSGYGTWTGFVQLSQLNFVGFNAETRCGARQSIFQQNPHATNKTPMHRLIDPVFEDVQDSALSFLSPITGGVSCSQTIDQYGLDPNCRASGPENILISFTDVVYDGTITPVGLYKDFQIVSNVASIGGSFDTCELKAEQNAY